MKPIRMFDLEPVLARAQDEIDRNFQEMRSAGQYITGPQLQSFELELAGYCGATAATGTGTGTSAIELCLREAGVVRTDQEVIVPALTSLFTAQAVLAAGARLRIADVDPDTLLLGPSETEQAWTSRTAAVICVHLYGNPCRVREIAAIASLGNAAVVQDACQAHGATAEGKPLSAYSKHVAVSFYPTKNLGCLGDGGAVLTTEKRVAKRLELLRDGGRRGDQISRVPAINSRLDELHACYLRAFLKHLNHWTQHRRRLAVLYDQQLLDVPEVRPVPHQPGAVHHLYVIRAPRRDALRAHLQAAGVQTGVHYPVPLHQHPAFRRRARWTSVPVNAENACREILSLPIGPHVDANGVSCVVDAVRGFYRSVKRT